MNPNHILALINCVSKKVVYVSPEHLTACLTRSGPAPNVTKVGVLCNLFPDLDQCITESLESLRCNLAESDGLNIIY